MRCFDKYFGEKIAEFNAIERLSCNEPPPPRKFSYNNLENFSNIHSDKYYYIPRIIFGVIKVLLNIILLVYISTVKKRKTFTRM